MSRRKPTEPPAAVSGDSAVTAALQAVALTETDGRNLSDEQYEALHSAVVAVLRDHPELATHAPLEALGLDLTDWDGLDLAAWILSGDLLTAHRGVVAAPSGLHGPWPGSRCVYCGSNDLDVLLYTVDHDVCPPDWECGAGHPDRRNVDREHPHRRAHCGLRPGHIEDHRYDLYHWPEAYDPVAAARERAEAAAGGWTVNEDLVGVVPAVGPPQLEVITWAGRTDT